MAVKKEDILEIPGESEWVVTPIVWSQSRKEYNKNYYRIKFSNTRGTLKFEHSTAIIRLTSIAGAPEKENFLFVSEEKLAAFKAKITKIDSGFKLTVDDDYQYGQQKEEVNRFLVYHDKERDIFQVRISFSRLLLFAPD